ncbi:Threonine efflux protein [Aminobacter sp. MSH1]|uniref:RhtB (Resistance to homoserine/threonine) family protein n=2 Tax=Phyllobacteriaceae TaxID=69277 RepID=A0ABR6L4E9_9HYPH|nr:Threonine efflux protein [Aminobacter sp. MSH1]MBB4651686.1 RhtB (resistance to homoserine/threonine) family protein [Aminobacter niigataensis]CAI2932347.1 L-lysine permease [Aminobacter niigataensis]
MMQYAFEFAGLLAVFSVLMVVPGADFVMVVRQSVVHGRRAAIITSFGIGTSLLFHVSYTILGIGLIVSKSLLLFSMLKWAGAAYLVYLGIRALRADPMELTSVDAQEAADQTKEVTATRCFLMGFVTNALNPKAVLLFVPLFTAMVSHETPAAVKGVYGLLMAVVLIAWFVGVSMFFTMASVRARFVAWGRWFNKATGMIFIGLGVKLATQQAS